MKAVKNRCRCPQCGIAILIKNLRRSPMMGTVVACVRKLKILFGEGLGEDNYNDDQVKSLSTPVNVKIKSKTDIVNTPAASVIRTPVAELDLLRLKSESSVTSKKAGLKSTPKRTPSRSLIARKSPLDNTISMNITPSNKRSRRVTTIEDDVVKPVSIITSTTSTTSIIPSTPKRHVFLTTGLNDDQKVPRSQVPIVQDLVSSSYRKLATTSKAMLRLAYTKDVTHIISGDNAFICPRTVKYMRGVLDGKFIVTFQWFLESLIAGSYIDDLEPYLVQGDDIVKVPTNAVSKSIVAHSQDQLGIFSGLTFFLAGIFNGISKTDLSILISSGGGRVQRQRPNSDDPIWVVYENESGLHWLPKYRRLVTVPTLLLCISHYSNEPLRTTNQLPQSTNELP